jgi:hypothetical protein
MRKGGGKNKQTKTPTIDSKTTKRVRTTTAAKKIKKFKSTQMSLVTQEPDHICERDKEAVESSNCSYTTPKISSSFSFSSAAAASSATYRATQLGVLQRAQRQGLTPQTTIATT